MRRAFALGFMLTLLLGGFARSVRGSPSADPMEQVTAPPPPRGPPPPIIRRPPEPTAVGTLGELGVRREHDGTYRYVDPARRFTARFNPDGTVQFADRWRRVDSKDNQHGQCCALPPEGIGAINPFWGVQFAGLAKWIIQAQGKDPAAQAKTELLERTREFRTQLAVAWHLRVIESRLTTLEPELLQAWSDESKSLEDRRDYLFRRWDECDERFSIEIGEIPEDAIMTIEEARQTAAAQARRKIERFIRRHAPPGSPRGFTEGELRNLNGRRVSKERFAPYRVHMERGLEPGAPAEMPAQ